MTQKKHEGISIFIRILVVFLCVNIATSGILLVIAFGFHRQSIEKRTKEAVSQQIEILRDNFEYEYRINLKRSLDVLVSSSIIDEYLTVSEFEKVILKKKIERMFIQTLKAFRTYHSIRFIDADGKINIFVTKKFRHKEVVNLKQVQLESPTALPPSLLASLNLFETLESIPLLLSGGYMEWFMPPRELQLEGPYVDENGTLSLLAGVSKLDLDVGIFGGVLIIRQKLEKFFEALQDVIFFNENLVWVYNANGQLLLSPEKKEYRLEPTDYLSETSQITAKLIDTKEGLVAYQDFCIIPGKPFIRVVISIPSTLLLKDFSSTIRFFSMVLICSLILVLLVALYVSRYLSRPIIELAHAANRLSEGDLTTRVKVKTTGEVQLLVSSFNLMAEELQQTILLNVRLDEAAKRKEELERINSELEGAKQTLAEREQRYRTLTGNLPGIVCRVDLITKNKLIFFNDMLFPMTGYRDNELMSAKICALESVIVQEDSERTIAEVKNAVLKMQPFEIEYRVKHKDGGEKYFLERGRPVHDSSGEPKYIDGVILDITDRKKAEKERQALETQLQQARKMESIGTLTGGIAHDFNNILGIIVGNTELALEDVPKYNPAHSSLEEIKTASLRATNIIKQLLNFSRKTELELQPVEIAFVIKDILKFLRSTIPSTIDIQLDIQATDEFILADTTQINQVMMNLCINASQSMEKAGGKLKVIVRKVFWDSNSAQKYSGLSSGEYVEIAVGDTGPGIAPENVSRIFDPYFTTKEVGKGSGMGLSVVHGIVKSHNGAISLDNKPGKGSTFILLFPITTDKQEIKKDKTDELILGSETVLLVDDEKSIVEMLQRMLVRLGYKVKTAMMPQDALDQFSADPEQFDLMITDMTMPKMNGEVLSQKIMEIRSDIPIIICTGHSSLIDEERAKQIGIAAYLMKPVNMTDISKAVRKVLDKGKC